MGGSWREGDHKNMFTQWVIFTLSLTLSHQGRGDYCCRIWVFWGGERHLLDLVEPECYFFTAMADIQEIRGKYKNEWLLIAVDKVDSDTHEPISGQLIAHGPARSDIHEAAIKYDGLAYAIYSEDWPEDLAACF
jgi:hypothetical protein